MTPFFNKRRIKTLSVQFKSLKSTEKKKCASTRQTAFQTHTHTHTQSEKWYRGFLTTQSLVPPSSHLCFTHKHCMDLFDHHVSSSRFEWVVLWTSCTPGLVGMFNIIPRSSQRASQEELRNWLQNYGDCSYGLSRPLEFAPPLSTFLCLIVISLCSKGSPLNSTDSFSGDSGKLPSSKSERHFPFGP